MRREPVKTMPTLTICAKMLTQRLAVMTLRCVRCATAAVAAMKRKSVAPSTGGWFRLQRMPWPAARCCE
jgi:hypothetical protein